MNADATIYEHPNPEMRSATYQSSRWAERAARWQWSQARFSSCRRSGFPEEPKFAGRSLSFDIGQHPFFTLRTLMNSLYRTGILFN
jgi:hypothetical protein